jgi:ABC-type transport system involved in cytochrome c biogenesis ATPase subunit
MKIRAVRWRQQVRDAADAYPRLILESGRIWTDRAPLDTTEYVGLFDVYVDEAPEQRRLLGSIKILQRGQPSVRLPHEMEALPEDCCSLGQTIDYYEALETLGDPMCSAVLGALRDVTADETLAGAFEPEPGFRSSLTRFSEAARIYHFRPRRLHRDRPTPAPLRLHFEANLPGFSEAEEDRHKLDLELHPEPGSVGRLAALVGKNGTGKTQLLARLAAALWGLHRHGQERLELTGPPVGRVIAVSYSALDAFERPPHYLAGDAEERGEARPAMDNYRYCGFRDGQGRLQPELLFTGFRRDFEDVKALGRLDLWKDMLVQTRLAEDDPDLGEALDSSDLEGMVSAAERLGAGQKTALTVLTRVLASLRNGALVLLDEPELNLHPSLLSALLRVVHDWLDHHDGYGIVATHSPIGLQEIPGRNVRVLRRVGRVPYIQPYESESFGQSLSEIVGEVFGAGEDDKNYVAVLRRLLREGKSAEQIEASFGRRLSLSARMALRALSRDAGEPHA